MERMHALRVSRRKFIAGSSGLAGGMAMAAFVGSSGLAGEALAQSGTPAPSSSTSPPFGYANTRSDSTAGINSGNAGQLGVAWSIATKDEVTGAPIVDGGKVYFADWGGNVYSADARTGKVLWQKQIATPNMKWPWHGLAGTGTMLDGTLFFASVEGDAYALDPASGTVKWQQHFAANKAGGSIGGILAHDGLLYIGEESVDEPLSSMDPNFKPDFLGTVVALDTATGKQAWEQVLVQPPGNGVAVWSGFALDPGTGMLYFSTGNNYTGAGTSLEDAIVAVDGKTGKIVWSRSAFQNDVWTPAKPTGPDYDFGAAPQLFEATVNGQTLKLVGDGQKSGIYWALDRATGDIVWKTVVGYGGIGGGIRGAAGIVDGTLYLWSNNGWTDGILPPKDPTQAPITIKALDGDTGQVQWVHDMAQAAIGSSSGFVANDVYFIGSLDGAVHAYATADGKDLWSVQGSSVGADLLVSGDTLYVGAGVPSKFGGLGSGSYGLVAYRPGAVGTPTVPAATPAAG